MKLIETLNRNSILKRTIIATVILVIFGAIVLFFNLKMGIIMILLSVLGAGIALISTQKNKE